MIESYKPIDSARKHNLNYLDEVISPTATYSKESLSEDMNGLQLDERGSTESAGMKRIPDYAMSEVTSNPSLVSRQNQQDNHQ